MPIKPVTQAEYDGKPDYRKQSDRDRGFSAERGYDRRWRKVRAVKLRKNPLCERCLDEGRTKAADLVHHKDRNSKNNRHNNLEALCISCHDIEHKHDRFKKRNDNK